jgi:prepilin-type N-terminal cleavage/methylation domain-containing protein
MRQRHGFTLIEVMIVISIIGILVAIALLNFTRFQWRMRASEVADEIKDIVAAEEAYMKRHGAYIGTETSPPEMPGRRSSTWVLDEGFRTMGFHPKRRTYYQHTVVVSSDGQSFSVGACADIDGDGTANCWGYLKTDPNGNTVSLNGIFSVCNSGVHDRVSSPPARNLLNRVGPCDEHSSKKVF